MLGNFSFGDYFKEEAIKLAHQFLIENCKLKIEIYLSRFRRGQGGAADEESVKIGVSSDFPRKKEICVLPVGKIISGPDGEEGPCGRQRNLCWFDRLTTSRSLEFGF